MVDVTLSEGFLIILSALAFSALAFSALTLLVGQQEGHPPVKN